MKIALAMCIYNDARWIELHAPTWCIDQFDGMVVLDGGSTDNSVALCEALGAKVFHRTWDNHFSNQFNALVEHVEAEGYTHIFRVDPDECYTPMLVKEVKRVMGIHPALMITRYNFVGDRLHYNNQWLPDWQFRAWQLHQGARYKGAVHEGVDYRAVGWGTGTVAFTDIPLLHYAWIAPLSERREVEAHYYTLMHGVPSAPEDHLKTGYPPRVPFTGSQPLDPYTIGMHAPYADDLYSPEDFMSAEFDTETAYGMTTHVRLGAYEAVDRMVVRESQEAYFWDKLPDDLRYFVDVGGHIGTYTNRAKQHYPDARVIVVEPEPDNFRMLKKNTGDLKTVYPYQGAVYYGDTANFVLETHTENSGGHKFVQRNLAEGDASRDAHWQVTDTEVTVYTLEELVKKHKFPRVDVQKWDAEFAELACIPAMSEELLKKTRYILGEWHGSKERFLEVCGTRLAEYGTLVEVTVNPGYEFIGMFFWKNHSED